MHSSLLFACLLLTRAAAQGTQQAAAQGGDQWEQKVDEQGRQVQSLKIEAPTMTEEDQYGYVMPDRYRCDACRAVVYHLGQAFEQRQPKSRRLQEWEYQDIFDETCKHNFKGYGITLIDGENALSGPALQHGELQPGMGAIQMGGEKWDKRMGEMCRKIVYESIGEEDIYEHFRATGKLAQNLCQDATRVCQKDVQEQKRDKKSEKSKKSKSNAKTMKKEKKAKSKKQTSEKTGQKETPTNEGETLDLNTVLTQMAKEHNVPASEYIQQRSRTEWERLFLQIAGRLYSGKALEESTTRI